MMTASNQNDRDIYCIHVTKRRTTYECYTRYDNQRLRRPKILKVGFPLFGYSQGFLPPY